ncbi:MAG TPA: hypothetical protein VEI28_00450 [Thermodesulfovibrionales bacterium]|nr:hypothetical protein [Thermodesulfovibrionales bacterium]
MTRLLVLVILLSTSVSAWPLNVTMSVKTEGGDRPVVVGTTNLPDGIELVVAIRRKESQYMAQTRVRVKDGSFRAGPFSQRGYALIAGIYSIEVSSSPAFLQPPSTWPTIGKDGAKMHGPLVRQPQLGGEKVVEYKASLNVKAGKTPPEEGPHTQAQPAKDDHESWVMACKDTCNMLQRVAQRRGEAFSWDRCNHRCVSGEPDKKK